MRNLIKFIREKYSYNEDRVGVELFTLNILAVLVILLYER